MIVFVSGPYSQGDVAQNVRNAVLAADRIRAAGHLPIVPHLNHLWHLISPHEYDYWIQMDLELLELCDVMVRLPGESPGADGEERAARELGIPVVALDRLMEG